MGYGGRRLDALGAGAMSQHDVDMRTRVGEALGQVIRRCGEALPSYGEGLRSEDPKAFLRLLSGLVFFFSQLHS